MSSEDAPTAPRLSYREQDVDETLDEHAARIGRLEKVALIGMGYGLAEGSNIVTDLVQFI